MTEQQLNDVWTYRLSESMESAIISDCEGYTVGHIIGVGLFPKKSTEKLAWRIVTDHNLGLLATRAAQREAPEGVPDYINDTIDNLRHYNYEMSYGGYLKHTRDVELIRAYVARTRQVTPQPADAAGFTLGPVSDGGMDPRDRQPAPAVQGVPVSAQFRYRRPERSLPSYSAWSAWQPAKVDETRPTFYFDEQGWEYEYRLLYTAPQPAPDVSALVKALEDLVSEIENNTCPHENTYRRGIIWEFCEDCGEEWSDHDGGKPEFAWPASVETARNLIHAHRKEKENRNDDNG